MILVHPEAKCLLYKAKCMCLFVKVGHCEGRAYVIGGHQWDIFLNEKTDIDIIACWWFVIKWSNIDQ